VVLTVVSFFPQVMASSVHKIPSEYTVIWVLDEDFCGSEEVLGVGYVSPLFEADYPMKTGSVTYKIETYIYHGFHM
jgi:hypothetical protein